jgi:CDGSH-type Zn-finger protein
MEKGKVAGKAPKIISLEKGKSYAWCACGLSTNQPFCDGSHKGTGFKPHVFKADKDKKAAFCMCKQTGNHPFCDGEHNQLG